MILFLFYIRQEENSLTNGYRNSHLYFTFPIYVANLILCNKRSDANKVITRLCGRDRIVTFSSRIITCGKRYKCGNFYYQSRLCSGLWMECFFRIVNRCATRIVCLINRSDQKFSENWSDFKSFNSCTMDWKSF